MAKLKKAVKPAVKAKRGRGRPASNKWPSSKTPVRAKGTKSLKGRLKAKSKRVAVKKVQTKSNSQKRITLKKTAKSVKQAHIVNKKRGRPAKSKAVKSNKPIQIAMKKIANA